MANYPLLATGQQAVTATAQPLAANAGVTPGQGFQVLLHALKANSASVFYGPSDVTTATGAELAPGQTDVLRLSSTALIYVVAAATGSSVTWSVTAL